MSGKRWLVCSQVSGLEIRTVSSGCDRSVWCWPVAEVPCGWRSSSPPNPRTRDAACVDQPAAEPQLRPLSTRCCLSCSREADLRRQTVELPNMRDKLPFEANETRFAAHVYVPCSNSLTFTWRRPVLDQEGESITLNRTCVG